MGRNICLSLVLSLLANSGCDSKVYPLTYMPFCAAVEPGKAGEFVHEYILLIKHDDGYTYGSLSPYPSGKWDLVNSSQDDEMLLALVQCPTRPQSPTDVGALMEAFDGDHVPTVCSGQKIIVHQELEAKEDSRTKAVGFGGTFRFPKVDLPCKTGQLTQEEDCTLKQILDSILEPLDRYHWENKFFPGTYQVLVKANMADPLPLDPWCTTLVYQSKGTQVFLISAGPDKKLGTDDDIEVLRKSKGSSNSITGFGGSTYPSGGDYKAFIEATCGTKNSE